MYAEVVDKAPLIMM
jgi:hypothetical protein